VIDAEDAASAFRRRRGNPAQRAEGRTATSSLLFFVFSFPPFVFSNRVG
jgi:hypothetical protein